MNRELRREVSKRKWLSRTKKIYNSYSKLYIPIRDIKTGILTLKACESISNFLDLSKYAKILKNCTSPFRSRKTQYEYKKENRKKRYSSKKDIQEGLQEYESRDNLSCPSCIFYDGGLCEKGLLMTDDCPEYWD